MPKKSMRCCYCKKMTRTQGVTISFRGLKIQTFKPGMSCYSCFKRKLIEVIKDLETKEYFKISGGRVTVNWEKCLKAYALNDEWNTDWNELLFRFIDLKVLSYKPAGNHVIMKDGSQFCLHNCGSSVYFIDLQDAKGFVEAYLAHYGVADNFDIEQFAD